MSDFVAYHSVEKWGDYQPGEKLNFYSGKSESFLRSSIGCPVWVVVGTRSSRGMSYQLAGRYVPAKIRARSHGHGVIGSGVSFQPPVELSKLKWFSRLFREQSNFSFGFNKIHDTVVLAELQKLLVQAMKPEPFSADDYVRAFDAVQDGISLLQRQMLLAHFSAPDRSITARQLAAAVGLSKFNAANLHYGKLARLLGSMLGNNPAADNVSLLASLVPPGTRGNKEWLWVMRPQVAQALQLLGFVPLKSKAGLQPIIRLTEGAANRMTVNVYERNPLARQQCIQHFGCRCSVCGFDFEKVFGEIGRGFIHVHHLKPLSQIQEEYEVDPITDLCPICPNCHAMIHSATEMISIQNLKRLIRKQSAR